MANGTNRELKSIGYELFILLLSLLSVVNMVFYLVGALVTKERGPAQDVVLIMDAIITPIFVFDFLYRLFTASSKRQYFSADPAGLISLRRFRSSGSSGSSAWSASFGLLELVD